MKWLVAIFVLILVFMVAPAVADESDSLEVLTNYVTQTDFWTATGHRYYSIGQADNNGTLDSLYVFLYNTTTSADFKGAIYDDSDGSLVDSTTGFETVTSGNDGVFLGMSFENKASISAGVNYRLVIDVQGAGTRISTYNETGIDYAFFREIGSGSRDTIWYATQDSTTYLHRDYTLRIYATYRSFKRVTGDTLSDAADFKDAYLDESDPTFNFGATQFWAIGVDSTGNEGMYNQYEFWNIATIGPESTLAGTFLWFYTLIDGDNDDNLELYPASGTFTSLAPTQTGTKDSAATSNDGSMNWTLVRDSVPAFNDRAWDTPGGDWSASLIGEVLIGASSGMRYHRIEIAQGWADGVAQGDTTNDGVFFVAETRTPASGDWHKEFYSIEYAADARLRPFLTLYYHTTTTNFIWLEDVDSVGSGGGAVSWETATSEYDSVIAVQHGVATPEKYMLNSADANLPDTGRHAPIVYNTSDATLTNIDTVYFIYRGQSNSGGYFRAGIILGSDTTWGDSSNSSTLLEDTLVLATKPGGGDWTGPDWNNAQFVFSSWNNAANEWTSPFIQSQQFFMAWGELIGDTIPLPSEGLLNYIHGPDGLGALHGAKKRVIH